MRKGREDVNALSDDGLTPLLVAAGSQHLNLDLFAALVELGSDLDAVDAEGETAMHKVIRGGVMDEGREAAVALLVKGGIDLAAASDGDGDLKHVAWQFGYGSIVEEALAEAAASPPHLEPSRHVPEISAAMAAAEEAASAAAAAAGVAADIRLEL